MGQDNHGDNAAIIAAPGISVTEVVTDEAVSPDELDVNLNPIVEVLVPPGVNATGVMVSVPINNNFTNATTGDGVNNDAVTNINDADTVPATTDYSGATTTGVSFSLAAVVAVASSLAAIAV